MLTASALLVLSGQIFAQTPIVSYSFEGNAAADDNNQYVGSFVSNASIVEMADGNHVLYTGNGYMDLTVAMAQAVAASLTGNYSISVDFCIGTVNSLSSFCWMYAFANSTSQYLGLINAAGNADWYYEIKNGSTTYSVRTTSGVTSNIWHNVTVVQNGNNCSVYIDGVWKKMLTVSLFPAGFASSITGAYLGKSPFAADALMSNTFIDNFKIYGSALTADEVSALYTTTQGLSTTRITPLSNIVHRWEATGNPVVTHKYTCDPAALVYNDTLFIFSGQDATGGLSAYNIKNWCCFATTDMKHFWEYETPLLAADFSWNTGLYAYAAQVIERNGQFYWYVSTNTTGIGVAVANRPEGPYTDALGHALLTNTHSTGATHAWRTIDPTVFIDDDNQAWLFWGNGGCWCVKLNADMISYNTTYGVKKISITGDMPFGFTEAPWIHKKDGKYFLSFATGFPERIEYAVSDSPDGPYTYVGLLNEIAGNSNTNHQSIVEYKDHWYFIYHNGGIQTDGGSYSRSVCIDKLEFDENGFYKPVIMTTQGVDMLVAPDPDAIEEISAPQSPFLLDSTGQTITMPTKSRYQIVDILGRSVKTGYGKSVSISNLQGGIYIISNGNESRKFIKK